MKVLIVASCLLAIASAGFIGQSAYGYAPVAHHAAHVPVLDHNGYQLDTPEVAHAKAAHFAAHAEASSRSGHGLYADLATPLAYAGHYASHYAGYYAGHYAGPQHMPVIGPHGVPLDTPEVAAGKVANAVAHAEAHARNGDHHGIVAPIAHVAGHGVSFAGGVPLDTPEVAHAKAVHFAAHIEAKARNGDLHYAHPLVHYRKRRGIFGAYAAPAAIAHAYTHHIPVIGHNGVPLETPEVVAAKAHHAAAHVEAKARNGDLAVVASVAYGAHGIAAHGLVAPYAVAHSHYAGPQHIPVIGPHGVPLDTPEVAAGKAANAVAHAEAHARNGDSHFAARLGYAAHGVVAPFAVAHSHHIPVIGHNGVPLDTPEVAAAKAHHAAAHVEAKVRNGALHHYY